MAAEGEDLAAQAVASVLIRGEEDGLNPAEFDPPEEEKKDSNGVRVMFGLCDWNEEEAASLEAFKKHLADSGAEPVAYKEPHRMMRFLAARGFNLEKAAAMLTASEAWRSGYVFRPHAELVRWRENMFWHGRDNSCRPILVVRLTNLSDIFAEPDSFLGCIITHTERAQRYMVSGRVESMTVIVDLDNASVRDVPYSLLKSLFAVLGDNYPFNAGRFYLLNCPGIISVVLRAVKKFMDPDTRKKINVAKKPDRDLWPYVRKSQVPTTLGGTAPWPPVWDADEVAAELAEEEAKAGGDDDDSATTEAAAEEKDGGEAAVEGGEAAGEGAGGSGAEGAAEGADAAEAAE
eukprot:PLAT5451.1.p2 GENE.PLAT5451.1~~PLAT5451.1.p2  ORF type:complete len:347 (-),score=170.75 PLAT5451.1:55-1095(-)